MLKDDGERVGAAGGRVAAVLHDDGQVVELLALAVERPLRRHDAGALTVVAAA